MNRRKAINVVKDYFTFTTSERNGVLVLLLLVILTAIVKRVILAQSEALKPAKEEVAKFNSEIVSYKESKNDFHFRYKKDSTYKKKHYPERVIPKIQVIDINKADSGAFEKLPGLGPYLSGRIIKYRHSLGGFYCIEQLLEVFGMREENYIQSKPYLRTDTLHLVKIDINKAPFKEVNAHPYISYEQTVAIFRLRNKGININQIALIQNNIFDSLQLKKVLIYLNF